MAPLHLLQHSLLLFHTKPGLQRLNLRILVRNTDAPKLKHKYKLIAASNSEPSVTSKPTRRGRKSPSSSSSKTSPRKTTRTSKKKPKSENGSVSDSSAPTEEQKQIPTYLNSEDEEDNYDDGMDFQYDDPPLVCCFGAVQKEFVPSVRVNDDPLDPDKYAEWKKLQWTPPEFARAPGGPPSNVAISHVRLGGRAAFLGKVGTDDYGMELLLMMNKERVQTRGVVFDEDLRTGCTYMKVKFDSNGKMGMETVREAAEDSFHRNELSLAVLKEARILHFNSGVLMCPSLESTLFRAIRCSKKFGGLIFFDLNLPLALWKSPDETREIIKRALQEADIVELSRTELEFLLDEDYYERRKHYRPQYYAENFEQTKHRRDYYHYTREEISPLWHDKLKFLFVTDGTLRIHYYTPKFDGVVVGTEDVLICPFTCDRTGSGDAVVAGILRKLTTFPEMFENQDILDRQLRFAISAGIIAQWTIGGVRGFPSESATQNLKEQVYIPSLW